MTWNYLCTLKSTVNRERGSTLATVMLNKIDRHLMGPGKSMRCFFSHEKSIFGSQHVMFTVWALNIIQLNESESFGCCEVHDTYVDIEVKVVRWYQWFMRLIEIWQIDEMSKWIYNQWDRSIRFTPQLDFTTLTLFRIHFYAMQTKKVTTIYTLKSVWKNIFQPISAPHGAIISTYVSNQRYNLIKMFRKTLMSSHHSTCVRCTFSGLEIIYNGRKQIFAYLFWWHMCAFCVEINSFLLEHHSLRHSMNVRHPNALNQTDRLS